MIRIKITALFCLIAIGQVFGQITSLPRYYSLPKLSNGASFTDEMAKYLDMTNSYEILGRKYDKYQQHTAFIEILVYKTGGAILDTADYRRGKLPMDKVREFIESHTFETTRIPNEQELWRFAGWISFMNKNKKEAKKEIQWKRKRVTKKHFVSFKNIINFAN